MSELRYCPMCGSKLPADAPAGLCPQCLLKQGFESGVGVDSASRGATVIGAGFVPPAPEELAKHFPQLEILELVGKGGMGAVYKARQPALDRVVALKILPPEVGTDPAFAERFTREARALAKLSHQNIVAVYDFGKTSVPDADSDPDAARDGLYYFLMEYVDGANLRQLIKSGGTQPAEALAIVPQICEALEFAHGEGVVHRDIKPENILVDQKGRVKIADFGLAKLLQAEPVGVTLTQAGQVMGTWYYMAPEQIERPLEVDHRADIYSLGVVFYEMLTGHVPSGRFDPPSKTAQIDVRLDEVVLRALEREPSRRYQHASDVKTQVESICGLPREAAQRVFGREFRSKTTLFGVPLVHIAFGLDPRTGRPRTAKGIIAIGDRAVGGIAIGGAAAGGVAIGGAAVGLLSLGGASLGVLMAIGGLAMGGLAFGGLSVGVVAIGGGAIGLYAYGGAAFGLHAMGANTRDPQAVEFFVPWVGNWIWWLSAIGFGMPIFGVLMWGVIWLVFYRQGRTGGLIEEEVYIRRQPRGELPPAQPALPMVVPIAPDVEQLILSHLPGDFGSAIKLFRAETGASVDEAVMAVEAVAHKHGITFGPVPIRRRLAMYALLLVLLAIAWTGYFLFRKYVHLSSIVAGAIYYILMTVGTAYFAVSAWRYRRYRGTRRYQGLVFTTGAFCFVFFVMPLLGVLADPGRVLNWMYRVSGANPGEHDVVLFQTLFVVIIFGTSAWLIRFWFRLRTQQAALSPEAPHEGLPPTVAEGAPTPSDSAQLARRPAIGLIIVGAMQLLFVAMYLLGTLADWEQRGFEAAWQETLELGPILLTGMALSVPVSILIILGAVRMMNLQSYRFALAAAILALLPLTFMVVVGVPFGIWALVVLARQRVKAAFPERPPAADDASLRPVRGPGIGLVVTGIANWIGIPIAISILLYFAAGPQPGGDPFILLMMVALIALLASSLMIAAGLLMMRQRAFWLCVVGSVLALVVTPGNLIGLPIGIWALVVLSQTDVRKRFGADRESSNGGFDSRTGPNAGRHLLQGPAESLLIVAGAALLWALGIALWLAFASAGWDPDAPGSSPQRRLQSDLLMFSITYAVYALCLAAAGLLMRRLHARLFALLSVVLVGILLPATLAVNVMMEHENIREWPVAIPMWLGMPVALWAAMVLFRHDVRDAFAIRESNAPAERPGTLARAWNDWWSQRDRTFTTIAKIVLLVLYVIGLWTFFSSQGGGRAEAFRHTIGQPSPWFVVEKDSGGFRWHITLNSWAWLVAFAAFGCYYAWYRIRLTEGTKIGRFETPPAQIAFWGVIAVFAIALAMSPLFLY